MAKRTGGAMAAFVPAISLGWATGVAAAETRRWVEAAGDSSGAAAGDD